MLVNLLARVLPPGAAELAFQHLAWEGSQPVLLPVTAVLVSVWAAAGVVTSLMQGFRATYGITGSRPPFGDTLVAMLLVGAALGPVLGASALLLLGVQVERWVAEALGLLSAGVEWRGVLAVLGRFCRYAVALGAISAGAALLYYFGPNRRQSWRFVWPGAVLSTLLWFGATSLFAWYVRHLANYNVVYGSIAAVIALVMWMYLLAFVALFGCEFNALWEKRPQRRQ
jgi:membrane protein